MAILTKNEKYIVDMYVRYFGKAPSVAEIAKYNDFKTPKLILNEIRGDADDSNATLTTEEFVNNAYQNLFGRVATTKEMNKYAKVVDAGKDLPINAIVKAAKKDDKGVYEAKKAIAIKLAEEKITTSYDLDKITKYTYTTVYDLKTKTLLVPVADLKTKIDAMKDNVSGETFNLTASADTFVGKEKGDVFNAYGHINFDGTFNPTLTGIDTLDGGTGKDTLNVITDDAITVANATISNIETINLESGAGVAFNTTTYTGVETLNSNKSADAVTLTAAATTDVNVSGVANTALGAGTVTTVNGGKTVTVTQAMDKAADAISVQGAVNVDVTATDVVAAAGIKVGTATAVTGTVNVTSTGATIADIAGATATAMDTIEVTGGTTVTVTQSANSTSGNAKSADGGDVVTQGTVTVIAGNATTTVTVKQDDQVAASAAVVAAGAAQTQTVTFLSMLTGESVTVNGLTFTAAKNLTAAEVAQAFTDLTSGDRQDNSGPTANGIYTGINTAGFTTSAANGATVTYTEVTNGTNAGAISASDTIAAANIAANATIATTGVANKTAKDGVIGVANGAVKIDDNATKSITDITVDGYGAGATLGAAAGTGSLDKLTTLTLKNSGTTGAANLTTASKGALTLNLVDVDAAVSLGATLTNLTINTSGEASTGAISAAGATTVTINAEAALSGASTFTAATLIDVNGTAKVDLTGATTAATNLATIDASGNTGGVTAVLGATHSVKFTGGAGNDSLTLGAAAIATGKNIDMGAGDDTLVLAAGTTSTTIVGTVTGGAGTDTLSMGYADAVAASLNTNFHSEVTGFEKLTINNVVGADDATDTTYAVNLNNLAYNYVTVNGTYSDADPEADTLSLTNAMANSTVAFGALSTAGSLYTVALADASGSADVINYVLASTNETNLVNNVAVSDKVLGTANNAGTITTNAVETFNISSTAVDIDGAQNVITANGNAVTTINVSGNAGVALTSTATTLKTVDASASTAGTLTFTANNASMTVKGGAGADDITITANADGSKFYGNAGNDTFHIAAGADLITIDGGAGKDTFDFNGVSTNKSNFVVLNNVDSGDIIELAGIINSGATTDITLFNSTKITLSVGATESTQAYLDQAMTVLTDGQVGWFQYNGNTFVTADIGGNSLNSFVDGEDFVVMITGLKDLSTASFNITSDTLEIA